jgi:hypothetical protein
VVHFVEVFAVLPAVFEPATGDLGELTGSAEAGGGEGVYFVGCRGGKGVVVDDVPEALC